MGIWESKSLKQELRENERKINKICNFLADEIKLFEERETQATQEFKLAAAKHDTLAATNGVVLKTMALNIVRVRKVREGGSALPMLSPAGTESPFWIPCLGPDRQVQGTRSALPRRGE